MSSAAEALRSALQKEKVVRGVAAGAGVCASAGAGAGAGDRRRTGGGPIRGAKQERKGNNFFPRII